MGDAGNGLDWLANRAQNRTDANMQTIRAREQDALNMQLSPLQQALRADQTRLALYANPDDPSKPLAGKENEYRQTLDRMTQTIGQMRQLYGQKPQGANPVEAGVGNLLDSLHITNHLKNHVAQVRADNAKKYGDQTAATAGAYAAGAMPFEMTPQGKQLAYQRQTEEEVQRLRNEGGATSYHNFRLSDGSVVPIDTRHQTPSPGAVEVGTAGQSPKSVQIAGTDGKPVFASLLNGKYYDQQGNEIPDAKPYVHTAAPSPKPGVSGGKNVFALLTDKGWVNADTREPMHDFRPAPSFAQTGLYGIDMVQNADGTIGSALLNRRTGEFKKISGQGGTPIDPALMAQVNKSLEPAIESDTRFRVMKDAEKDALNGNQQAMLNIVANHMGMTLGQQRGTRISQAQWNEAIASAPWVDTEASKWFHTDPDTGDHVFDGYKGGVNITPTQIHQMVDLAVTRRKRQWQQAQQAGSVYGVNVPIPEDLDNPSSALQGPVYRKNMNAKHHGGRKSLADRLSEALQ
jgi:hypothetical protein